ncbi:MAG: ATP-binding protein [Deltaproteobacteria bacterium]|nr:MAG: ATP-binding protein [Deltaproteobacteria bacterium]
MKPYPQWASELRRKYLRGEVFEFILHNNVHDQILYDGNFFLIPDFLAQVLLKENKSFILHYNLTTGITLLKGSLKDLDFGVDPLKDAGRVSSRERQQLYLQKLAGAERPEQAFPLIERILFHNNGVAVLIDFAEMIAPAGEVNFLSEQDRASVITLQRWSMHPDLERKDNVIILITEQLSELSRKLLDNPKISAIEVPLPDREERRRLIAFLDSDLQARSLEHFTDLSAGLKTTQIRVILRPHPVEDEEDRARLSFIRKLLKGTPDAEKRARMFAERTRGMSEEEIRFLLAPHGTPPPAKEEEEEDAERHEEIVNLFLKRKEELLEQECFGLVQFIRPAHGFEAVGGLPEVKRRLMRVAEHIKAGRKNRVPMGILFTGPMGTGKTFVAEAFAKASGLTTIKFKNFRSKWVGATEGNLERILSVVKAIGQVIIIIDEVDRAFGTNEGEGDGGTSSRVIARLKEFMSDSSNRGNVLFILMTNRPDKLDVDIKRAGRIDLKIPFFYAETPEGVEEVLLALIRRYGLKTSLEFPRDRETVSRRLIGYSNADLEAILISANNRIFDEGQESITAEALSEALADYLPSRDLKMLEYMELLAVFESSSRRLLPQKYANMSAAELQARLEFLSGTIR